MTPSQITSILMLLGSFHAPSDLVNKIQTDLMSYAPVTQTSQTTCSLSVSEISPTESTSSLLADVESFNTNHPTHVPLGLINISWSFSPSNATAKLITTNGSQDVSAYPTGSTESTFDFNQWPLNPEQYIGQELEVSVPNQVPIVCKAKEPTPSITNSLDVPQGLFNPLRPDWMVPITVTN